MLKMKSRHVIPYTDSCSYLGNIICSLDDNVIKCNAITDMNRTSWSGGRIMAKQSSDRGIISQVNPIILRDLTQECRKNI